MGSIGILRNGANIFPAAKYKTSNVSTIAGAYFNSKAVKAFDPNTPMMDTKEIPAGVLGGTYSIGFFYDSDSATVQGTPLMRIELYEDGVLMEEDTTTYSMGTQYQYDLNYVDYIHDYGVFINKTLDANKTHRLVVKTSQELSNDVILDYVIFEKVASNNIIDGKPIIPRIGLRNSGDTRDISDYGTQLVGEQITGILSGSITAGNYYNYGYTYNTPFKTVIGAYPTIIDSNGQLLINWSDWLPEYNQVKIYIKNISETTWSKVVSDTNAWNYPNVRIFVVGYI